MDQSHRGRRSPWTNYTAANRTYGRPGNFAAFQTFREIGITTVTGDNTRIELLQENMHHGLWSNEKTQGMSGALLDWARVTWPLSFVHEHGFIHGAKAGQPLPDSEHTHAE
jgi:hypothetical protein